MMRAEFERPLGLLRDFEKAAIEPCQHYNGNMARSGLQKEVLKMYKA